jgi:hypothetical protein
MKWQDMFDVKSGLAGSWYPVNSFCHIYWKDTARRVEGETGYDTIDEAFEAAELLFNRLENESEKILLDSEHDVQRMV